jgi:hypothetical protein
MAWGNAVARSTGNAQQHGAIPWGVPTHVLFLQRPTGFDGIEVGRVGREVDDAYALSCAAGNRVWFPY